MINSCTDQQHTFAEGALAGIALVARSFVDIVPLRFWILYYSFLERHKIWLTNSNRSIQDVPRRRRNPADIPIVDQEGNGNELLLAVVHFATKDHTYQGKHHSSACLLAMTVSLAQVTAKPLVWPSQASSYLDTVFEFRSEEATTP